MRKLTLPEVLSRLEKERIPMTKRSFEYYQRLGLLPRPEKKVGAKGRGVYGYYMPSIIRLIKYIFTLKNKGYELNDILNEGNKKIIDKFGESFKKWGEWDKALQDTKGFNGFEERVLKTYHLWDIPGKIERDALHHILNRINDLLPGLEESLSMVKEELATTKDEERKALERIIERLNTTIQGHKNQLSKIYRRIGEIERGELKPEKPILMWEGGDNDIM
jgi:DNA-binding transcriptional MerR regulator